MGGEARSTAHRPTAARPALEPSAAQKPSAWLSVALLGPTLVGAGAWMWSSSLPAGSFWLGFGALGVLLVAGVCWCGLALVWVADRRRGRMTRVPGWTLPLAAAVVVAAGGLAAADVPLRARWAASEHAFDATVARAQVDASSSSRARLDVPRRIGAYRIDGAERIGSATFFETTGSPGIFATEGFVHLPGGPGSLPADLSMGISLEPLGGDWYTWIIHD